MVINFYFISDKRAGLHDIFFRDGKFDSQTLQLWLHMRKTQLPGSKFSDRTIDVEIPIAASLLRENVLNNVDSAKFDETLKLLSPIMYLMQSNLLTVNFESFRHYQTNMV